MVSLRADVRLTCLFVLHIQLLLVKVCESLYLGVVEVTSLS